MGQIPEPESAAAAPTDRSLHRAGVPAEQNKLINKKLTRKRKPQGEHGF